MSRFIRVDLPTLGDPMMFTKPERCGAFAFVWDTELGLDLQRKRSALSSPSRLREMHRGVEQLVARRAHNPKVAGSSPATATQIERVDRQVGPFLMFLPAIPSVYRFDTPLC